MSLRWSVLTLKCPHGEIYLQRSVRTAKGPYGKISYGEIYYGEKSYGEKSGQESIVHTVAKTFWLVYIKKSFCIRQLNLFIYPYFNSFQSPKRRPASMPSTFHLNLVNSLIQKYLPHMCKSHVQIKKLNSSTKIYLVYRWL